ncbi:hypothetical protein LV84_03730 [Algoriphagus ratkowskyi]|uniref:Uncharacterized protein n=1 Tax=Algoriphagus ratkowskyi TaxID=57028 RepID=A0A2W7QSL7_9BACT|nr:hypothetical protein [Algoriphagus ratkowskyi]PZX51573.1 hypothetical protein LV84_03730 [Algoriphagus ratkowskyi]TXD78848.1 hypothetical protein ESW18_04830 [Algoriphagus ratkowskyi]
MKYIKIMIALLAATLVVSCSQGEKSSEEHIMTEAEGQDHGTMEAADHGGQGESTVSSGEMNNWTPGNDGVKSIQSDFHFIAGAIENINPEVLSEGSQNVMKLTSDGTPTAFVFHTSYGNVGMAAMLNLKGFNGTVKLIHHAQNTSNYEFVAINSDKMKLGRVVDGKEEIFDEKTYESADDWTNLRVSAAGTHFKGYIGNKTITHGHGDMMKDGYVGIMLEGKGMLQIKYVELTPMENE